MYYFCSVNNNALEKRLNLGVFFGKISAVFSVQKLSQK